MMKHIKKDSHAFLFFLGGLFLMLVGPSLIPTTSAATTTTATATTTNFEKLSPNDIKTIGSKTYIYFPHDLAKTAFTYIVDDLVKSISKAEITFAQNGKIISKEILPKLNKLTLRIGNGGNIDFGSSNTQEQYFYIKFLDTKGIQVLSTKIIEITNRRVQIDTVNGRGNSHQAGGPFRRSFLHLTSKQALANANLPDITSESSLTTVVKYFTQVFTTLFDTIQNNLATIMKYLEYTNAKQDIIIKYMKESMTDTQQATLMKDIDNLNAEYLNIQYNNEGQYLNTNVLQKETQKDTHASAGNTDTAF